MSDRRLAFRTGNRLLFVGRPSAIPNYDPNLVISDESRLSRALHTHIDTEQEAQQVINLAESYNQACMPARSVADARAAIIGLAKRGRLVVVEVEDLSKEPELDDVTASNVPVSDMAAQRKMEIVVNHALAYIEANTTDQAWRVLKDKLKPATIVVSLILLAGAFATGVGAVIVIAVGWALIGWSAYNFAKELGVIIGDFASAGSDTDLKKCGDKLGAAFITFGVELIIGLLTRGAGRMLRARHTSMAKKGGGAPDASAKAPSKREKYIGKTPSAAKRPDTGEGPAASRVSKEAKQVKETKKTSSKKTSDDEVGTLKKKQAETPNTSFDKEKMRKHAENREGKRKNGISGAHKKDTFEKELAKEKGVIVERKKHPTIDGVEHVKYKIQKGDGSGELQNKAREKTIYDSEKVSTDQWLKMGEEGSKNAPKVNEGKLPNSWEGTTNDGIKIKGHADKETGDVTTFYPAVD